MYRLSQKLLTMPKNDQRSMLILCLSLSGCFGAAGGAFENLIPVAGTVTVAGTPLDHGSIALLQVDPNGGKPAFGDIHDGAFTLKTTVEDYGAVIGKYRVEIVSLENIDPASMPTPDKPPIKIKSLVPKKYNKAATSGLEVEITEGMRPLELKLEP